MSNVLDQAQNFSGGVVAAARKRDSWALKEANATDEGKRRTYREAIFDLEERYPDLHDVPVGGAEAFARERGHGTKSRSPVHGGRRRPRTGSSGAPSKPGHARAPVSRTPDRKPVPGIDPSARRAPRAPAAKPQPTPRVDRAIRRTGIPQAVDAGGSTVMAALGATVGLSLAYLVVSSAEQKGSGAAAFPTLVQGVTRMIGRFIGLGDVFPGNGGHRAAGAGTTATTGGARHHLPPARLKPNERGTHSFNNR